MRTGKLILLVAAVIAMLTAVPSCRKGHADPAPGESPVLKLSVYVNGKMATRTDEGTVAATGDEKAINSFRVWIFLSQAFGDYPAGTLLGYLEPDPETYNFTSGREIRLSVPLEESFAQEASAATVKPRVTIYAAVNSEAAGLDEEYLDSGGIDSWGMLTPSFLNSFMMEGDEFFGTEPLVTGVPDSGLPMAGVLESVPISGSFPVLSIPTVTVTRLVSRIRFIFCQQADGSVPADGFFLNRITLTGSIGASERVFTGSSYSSSGTQAVDLAFDTSVLPSAVAANPSPLDYAYSGYAGAPQEWEDKLDEGIAAGHLTEWKRIYLRESDRAFTGTIRYRVGSEDAPLKTASFNLDAGDFTRNHSWVIYAYFLGGKLYVKPSLIPWEAGHDVLTYATEGSTELLWNNYLRYQPSSDSWNWEQTWVACAWSAVDQNTRPRFSPELSLQTNHTFECWLQVNNPNFRFWSMEQVGADTYHYTDCGTRVVISPATGYQNTTFFLVPDNTEEAIEDPYADVTVTVRRTDGMPPYNVPFNHDLPGAEDHTTIRFKNIGAAEYSANQFNEKLSSREQAGPYWVEVK